MMKLLSHQWVQVLLSFLLITLMMMSMRWRPPTGRSCHLTYQFLMFSPRMFLFLWMVISLLSVPMKSSLMFLLEQDLTYYKVFLSARQLCKLSLSTGDSSVRFYQTHETYFVKCQQINLFLFLFYTLLQILWNTALITKKSYTNFLFI